MDGILQLISPCARCVLIPILLALTLGFAIYMTRIGSELKTPEAPKGGLSLQFAWTQDRAVKVIDSWEKKGVTQRAFWHIILDFPFILIYTLFFALSCMALIDCQIWPEFGGWMLWATGVAAICDMMENIALLKILRTGATAFLARAGTRCSTLKWVLIILVIGYCVIGFIEVFWKKVF